MSLRVLVNAGPWVEVPPRDYGGIENVVATLVPALRALGARVVLATVGESSVEADERLVSFPAGQFASLARPYNQVAGIAHAHMQHVVRYLRGRDDVDIVHDHLEVVGPAVLAAMGTDAPPTLHTLHWDLRRNADFYATFDGRGRVLVNGVSESQLRRGHPALRAQAVGWVPLATPIPAGPPAIERGDHVVVLGRVCRLKGQDIAARVCAQRGVPLVLAGPVGPARSPEELVAALADPASPAHGNADVRFYLDHVRPYEDRGRVRWVGAVDARRKAQLLATARALLMPIRWEEPGATAVVEALAAGTPVLAMRRGVLPSLVDDGRTGWLVEDDEGLARALDRLSELSAAECRGEAERRFTPERMARRYLELYAEVVSRAAASSPVRCRRAAR